MSIAVNVESKTRSTTKCISWKSPPHRSGYAFLMNKYGIAHGHMICLSFGSRRGERNR